MATAPARLTCLSSAVVSPPPSIVGLITAVASLVAEGPLIAPSSPSRLTMVITLLVQIKPSQKAKMTLTSFIIALSGLMVVVTAIGGAKVVVPSSAPPGLCSKLGR